MSFKHLINRVSLKWRVIAVVLVASAAATTLTLLVCASSVRSSLHRSDQRSLTLLSQAVAKNGVSGLEYEDEAATAQYLMTLQGDPALTAAVVLDAKNKVFAAFERDGAGSFDPQQDLPASFGFTRDDGNAVIYQPIEAEGKQIGAVYVARDDRELQAILGDFQWLAFLVFVGVIVGAGILAVAAARGIVRPVMRTTNLLGEIASGRGDLTQRLPDIGRNELGALSIACNDLLEMLGQIIVDLTHTATEIEHATRTVDASSQNIAVSTGDQATNVVSMVSGLKSILDAARHNAESAAAANSIHSTAQQAADLGRERMETLARTMNHHVQSVEQVTEIVGMITDIAFQTNILALNASVEAARAGDAGRGFAVVAEEVRSLATRTAEAAERSSEVLTASLHEAREAREASELTSSALTEITESTEKLRALVVKIAHQARDQVGGIEDVNRSASNLDGLTAANASEARELAASARDTAGQVERLSSVLGSFKVEA